MKISLNYILFALLSITVLINGCKEDDELPVAQQQLEKLSSRWTITEASDGIDRTDDFPGVVLTIRGTFNASNPLGPYTYAFSEGTFPPVSPWPKNGNWTFKSGNETTTIIRQEDAVEITYTISSDVLELQFVYDGGDGFAGGPLRTKSISGNWTFRFTRN